MTRAGDPRRHAAELRRQAEETARARAARRSEEGEVLSPEEARRALHELRVHQIELEMQNEELRRAQSDLEVARARYFDLYELAPVGYCTLSEQGLVLEANVSAAALLGVARGALLNQPIARFICEEDREIYFVHRTQLFASGEAQACEVRMLRAGGNSFWAQLNVTAGQDTDGRPVCLIVLSDVDECNRAKEALLQSRNELHRLSARLLTAREAERGRLAEELHDGICQTLVGLGLTLDAALRLDGDEAAEDREAALGLVASRLLDAAGEVRAMFTALRPAMLDELGLVATISWFFREFQVTEPGIRVVSRVELEEDDVPRTLRTWIFRILQEAVNNVANHSRADQVVLSIRKHEGGLELAVEDNGRGFDSKAPQAEEDQDRGIGLGCMRQWTELSGGAFVVESRSGEGTAVRARWPLAMAPPMEEARCPIVRAPGRGR